MTLRSIPVLLLTVAACAGGVANPTANRTPEAVVQSFLAAARVGRLLSRLTLHRLHVLLQRAPVLVQERLHREQVPDHTGGALQRSRDGLRCEAREWDVRRLHARPKVGPAARVE